MSFVSDDQIPHTILAALSQCQQPMVVAPIGNADGKSQLGMRGRETPADITLWAHIDGKGGQPFKKFSPGHPPGSKPVATAGEEVEQTVPANMTRLIHSIHRQPASELGE